MVIYILIWVEIPAQRETSPFWEYAPNVPEDSSDLDGVRRDLNLHFPIITSQRGFLCVLAGFMLS